MTSSKASPSSSQLLRAWRWVPALLLTVVCSCSYACVMLLVLLPAAGAMEPFGVELVPAGLVRTQVLCALVGYHVLWVLAALAAVTTARTPPGHIPLWLYSREPGDQAYFHNVLQAVEKKLDGTLRFCRKCGAFKPDLAHHSRQLGLCVLCYQHFDIWSNNGIGFYNYKAYLLMLFYGALAHAATLALLLPGTLQAWPSADARLVLLALWTGGSSSVLAFAWLACAASALLGAGALAWLLFHAMLVAQGRTAHSYFRQRSLSPLKPPKPPLVGRPFDFGPVSNFGRACGKHPLLWLLPTNQGVDGNGIFFEINLGAASEGGVRYN